MVVRENTEDFYVGIGSRFTGHQKTELKVVREIYNVKFGLDIKAMPQETGVPDRGRDQGRGKAVDLCV